MLLIALAFLAFAILRVLGIDSHEYAIVVLALTPYVAVGGVLLALLAFLVRRRIIAFAVLLLAVWLIVLLVPRVLSNGQPEANGPHLRIMSANLHFGDADAAAVVRLVRDNRVDVLTLSELTERAVVELDAAGLAAELPYRVFDPAEGGRGSGIASRFPLDEITLVNGGVMNKPAAVVQLSETETVEIVAVHIPPPVRQPGFVWQRELAQLPPATLDATVRVLAGDFNATLDHATFTDVLSRGYADAADQTGHGLLPTWANWPFGPPLTIDHILFDRRCAVIDYAAFDLPGSDHSAVFAELVLP